MAVEDAPFQIAVHYKGDGRYITGIGLRRIAGILGVLKIGTVR